MILFLVIALPLFSFILLQLGGRFIKSNTGFFSALMALSSSFGAFYLLLSSNLELSSHLSYEWIKLGESPLNISLNIDGIALKMLVVINAIAVLVQLFSIAYMKGDEHLTRYFSYLGLFTFAMNAMVVMDSLILVYVFWELVGFSSYLLIGFWQHKESAGKAANKAFIINRVGDAAFLIGIMIAYWAGVKTISEFQSIFFGNPLVDYPLVAITGLCFFIALMAKSAQLPLATWLPDAMEGPTPVSALIHAATMVAAGVYLLIRMSFLLTQEVLFLVTIVGSCTAFLAAIAALSQHDIKKVLAYSTISQLGFMVTAIGMGKPEVAFFHLITHAFFKACLFLSAGSIIHALHDSPVDPQDLRTMGGLKKKLPITYIAMVLSGASLAGIPLFSGFLSKEAILLSATENNFAFLLLAGATLLTAFYITRLIVLSMWGELPTSLESTIKNPSWPIKIPLIILSIMSLWFGFSISPIHTESNWWVSISKLPASFLVVFLSIGLTLVGVFSALFLYGTESRKKKNKAILKNLTFLNQLSFNFFYIDSFVSKAIPNSVVFLSTFLLQFEKKIMDGFIDRLAIFIVVLGHISRWVDKFVVDGLVNLLSISIYKTGVFTGGIQGKSVQKLIINTILIVSILGFIFYRIYLSLV